MLKQAYIGAFVPLLIGSTIGAVAIFSPARADEIAPMAGAKPILPSRFTPSGHASVSFRVEPMLGAEPILPSRFTPMTYEVKPSASVSAGPSPPLQPPRKPPPPPMPTRLESALALPATQEASLPAVNGPPRHSSSQETPSLGPHPEAPVVWSQPLVDRPLSQAQKTADVASELLEAISRIVPIYDPTRLEGPGALSFLKVSAGTAVMDNVFADHWRQADPDPNIDVKVTYLALAWQMKAAPCDAFFKNRAHAFGEPALTALSQEDCARLTVNQARGFVETSPAPIVVAPVSVPVFAAPMPGSRLSSKDFWAAQRARVAAIQAHIAQRFHPAGVAAR